MSTTLTRALADAAACGQALTLRARTRPSSNTTLSERDFAGSVSAGLRSTGLATHAEQYRHFSGWPFAAIKVIGQRLATLPFHVGRRHRGRRQGHDAAGRGLHKAFLPGFLKAHVDQLDLLDEHPLLDAVDDPNPLMVRWVLLFCTAANLLLTGKAFWWFREGEGPRQGRLDIWPLPSNWMEPDHSQALFGGWKLKIPGQAGDGYPLHRDTVAYMYLPRPDNPLDAISPLAANARAVVVDEQIQEAQRNGFTRGVFADWAVVVGRHPDAQGRPGERPFLTSDQKRQIIHALTQAYRGVAHAGQPIILDALIEDVKRLSSSNREMDFRDSSKHSKERITQGYATNPIVMGQIEGANRASAVVAEENFCQAAVNPLAELISQGITAWAGPLYGDESGRLVAYLEPARAEDPETQVQEENLLISGRAIRVDELRARHNLPPWGPEQGGDEIAGGGAPPSLGGPFGGAGGNNAGPDPKPPNQPPADDAGDEDDEEEEPVRKRRRPFRGASLWPYQGSGR